MLQQMVCRGANQNGHITRRLQGGTRQGGDAGNQRFAIDNRFLDGNSSAHILHHNTQVGRQFARRHFLSG